MTPDLSRLSIEELGEIQVTSVSKRPESIRAAASAIYVITQDDIARSGAKTIPEVLRLAPNLQVAQAGASRYAITARGLNGAPAAQNFANKLLVLIDGRTVYTPLYSGVYWDMQDVLLQDVERIEVISGPGATLWGANAVNGVINIITRKAGETQGGLVAASVGDRRRDLAVRYGGRISDSLDGRVYLKNFEEADARALAGGSAHDHWGKTQGGFRLDWTPTSRDAVTLQGDAYGAYEAQPGAPAGDVSGRNLTARWTRSWSDGANLQVQAFYDRAAQKSIVDGAGFHVDTFDADFQHSFRLGERHELVWGGGLRDNHYVIHGTATLKFAPASRDLHLANLFVQDAISLGAGLKLILGVKVEDDPYVRAEVLPNARLSWTVNDSATLWAAVSRAVRSPTPFDRDVVEYLGGSPFLLGDPEFRTEKLTAYEAGAKVRPTATSSLSISAFYNDYTDLRSIEPTPVAFIPLYWGNGMKGRTYGFEAWGDLQATPWWRLSASVAYLEEKFRFQPGASGLLGPSQAANDPKYRADLRSAMNLGRAVTLDADLRYVSALRDPRVPAYAELDARIGWNISDRLQLAITGRNLLHDEHQEYPDGAAIRRGVSADLQWRF